MAFDYKKEYKEFYMPKSKPSIVEIPKMNYIAVRGKGNPNEEDSEYKKSIKEFFNSLVKEVNNMTFLPEDHIRTDYNPIDRLLTEVSYHNYEDFKNWLK